MPEIGDAFASFLPIFAMRKSSMVREFNWSGRDEAALKVCAGSIACLQKDSALIVRRAHGLFTYPVTNLVQRVASWKDNCQFVRWHPTKSGIAAGLISAVDADTGRVAVVKLCAVDDVGTVINPLTLEGQLHASTAQGLGETLLEQMIYDAESGQLPTGSFQDCALPRADNATHHPEFDAIHSDKTQSARHQGRQRARKCWSTSGDYQCDCRRASSYKVTDVSLPATSEQIWRLIHEARP